MNGSGYTIVQAGAEVPAEEFVRRYVDLADPAAGCRPCPDYGQFWTCPPYDVAAADYWAGFDTVLLGGCSSTSPRPCWSGGLTRRSWRNIPGS